MGCRLELGLKRQICQFFIFWVFYSRQFFKYLFVRNGKKYLGSITPALSFFSIYYSKKFSSALKRLPFERRLQSKNDQVRFFSRFFSKTILPKNVGKFRVLDPIQRRLDYFSKFFRDYSKKCLAGMWIRSPC